MENLNVIIKFFIMHNVPFDTVILILMLPIIATLITFFRQVVGIKAFGIYTPLIITFAFLATGIKYGLAIFIAVVVSGMISRFILKPFRLLYLPRVAIMLTLVALVILSILLLGGSFKRTGLASVSIFPILIIITLVEKFSYQTVLNFYQKIGLYLIYLLLFHSAQDFSMIILQRISAS